MSRPASASDLPVRRIDRILTFMSLGLLVIAIACFFATFIAASSGISAEDFASGVWPLVRLFPLLALPVSFVLLLTVLIMSFVRRSRANRGA